MEEQNLAYDYWMEWLKAFGVNTDSIAEDDLVEWMNDMEESVGDCFIDMLPDEWLPPEDDDLLEDDEDEWEILPSEEEDD
jgi:5-methylthioribose kinase